MRGKRPTLKKMHFIHSAFKHVARAQLGNGTLVFGSPGSGKTTIILPYIAQLVASGEKLLTLDVKGEQYEKLGIPFLAPWLHGSLILDIGGDITTKAQAQMLANALIIVNESDKNKVWQAAANSVGAALIFELVQSKPMRWTWTDLADQLDLSVEQWLALMMKVAPESAKVLQGAAEVSSSVAFNVITSLRSLRTVADMFAEAKKFGGKMFSLRKWLWSEDYHIRQVILQFNREYAASVGFVVPFIIEYIASQISGLPNNTSDPKNIILDEFAQLPFIASICELFEVGRSKGFLTLLAVQDWAQVKEKYGDNRAGVIFSNASIKVIARTSVSQSQAELANLMGTREVASVNISHSSGGNSVGSSPSTSLSLATVTMPLLLPSELESTIGPHSYRKNPTPGGDPIPTQIRAYLRAMSGDIFCLDWPVLHFPMKKKTPRKLPSQHLSAELFRHFMRDESRSPSERLRAAIAHKELGMSWQDVAALLYADGWMTDEEWHQRKAGASRETVQAHMPTMDKRGQARQNKAPPPVLDGLKLEQMDEPPSSPAQAAQPSQPLPRNTPPAAPPARPVAAIDALIIEHRDEHGAQVYAEERGAVRRFEGLTPEASHAHHGSHSIKEETIGLLEAAERLIAPASEAAHGIGLVKHAVEALELLERKQAPEPIMTPTTQPEADAPATGAASVAARLAAKKRASQTQKH